MRGATALPLPSGFSPRFLPAHAADTSSDKLTHDGT